jgi:hypothetical protein
MSQPDISDDTSSHSLPNGTWIIDDKFLPLTGRRWTDFFYYILGDHTLEDLLIVKIFSPVNFQCTVPLKGLCHQFRIILN